MSTLVLPREKVPAILVVLFSSLIIGLFAKIVIPLPFSPVPFATQNMVVLFLALVLGPRKAAASVFLFLLEGAAGLPVFAQGGSGLLWLAGPTGGYLFGYFLAAYATGAIQEKWGKPVLAMTAGALLIHLCGASYLATFIGVQQALLVGVLPFIAGDVLKIFACLKILPGFRTFS